MRRNRLTAITTGLAFMAACSPDAPTQPIQDQPVYPVLAKSGSGGAATTLELCKVAGTGVAAGAAFDFTVARGGVARAVAVEAGKCSKITVPMLSEPLGKGAYGGRAALIAQLLPAGAVLPIGGAALDASRVVAILNDAASVQASSSLTLNLAQQLIAARLNMLQGIQPTQNVLSAIADAQAAIAVSLGASIAISTSLSADVMGPLVKTITAFNEGKSGTPAVFAELEVDENVPAAMAVAIACNPSDNCSNTDVAAGKVTARVNVGNTTRVTFTNSIVPTLTLCQVAGPGVAEGKLYEYVHAIPLGPGSTGRVHVPAGGCVDVNLPPESYHIAQFLPDNEIVTSVVCEPTARCTNTSPATLSVYLDIVAGLNTRVTFTNRSTLGTLRVCKIGTGIGAGATIRFDVFNTAGGAGGTQLFVPVGECRDATVPEGNFQVLETVPVGTTVTAIACEPQERCTGTTNVALGYRFVDIAGGMRTTLTFTNTAVAGMSSSTFGSRAP